MATVVFVMIDGMRPDGWEVANTPVLDKLQQRGAWTMTAQAVMPSLTLPCHASIFYGQPPELHGITSNTWTPMAHPLPSIVDQAASHDRRCGFFHTWEQLRGMNQPGSLYLSYFHKYQKEDVWGDKPIVKAAINHLKNENLDFIFLYFGTPDYAGHLHGWMSPEYLEQINRVDGLLGQFVAGLSDEDSILIQADHGGHEQIHGTDLPEDMIIPWLVVGPNIRQNHEIKGDVNLINTAPTLARLLGVQPHPDWEGHCIDEIFLD